MFPRNDNDKKTDLLDKIRTTVTTSAERINGSLNKRLGKALPVSGKMLRSRMAVDLFQAGLSDMEEADFVKICAAVELIHTASLCHDDVIDEAAVRRHVPTLWRQTTPSSAVLVGDMLLCDAMRLVAEAERGRFVQLFVDKTAQICRSESEQELLLRGKTLTTTDSLRIAREKTGPLFGFLCHICGGSDPQAREYMEESGYLVGTGYQLMDDLIDTVGSEKATGKTLRNDASRRKYTLAYEWQSEPERLAATIEELSQKAVETVSPWPQASAAVERFLYQDLRPLYNQMTENVGIEWQLVS